MKCQIVHRVESLFALADQSEARIRSAQRQVDALKRPQSETAGEFSALLHAIHDRAFKGEL